MILTELNEQELKETNTKLNEQFKFIFKRFFEILFFFVFFVLVLVYIYILSEKNKLEKIFSANQELLKRLDSDIKTYRNFITTYTTLDFVKKKCNLKELYLPSSIYYVYNDKIIKIK